MMGGSARSKQSRVKKRNAVWGHMRYEECCPKETKKKHETCVIIKISQCGRLTGIHLLSEMVVVLGYWSEHWLSELKTALRARVRLDE